MAVDWSSRCMRWLGEDQEDDQGGDGMITLSRHVCTLRNYSIYTTYTGSIAISCAYVGISSYLLHEDKKPCQIILSNFGGGIITRTECFSAHFLIYLCCYFDNMQKC